MIQDLEYGYLIRCIRGPRQWLGDIPRYHSLAKYQTHANRAAFSCMHPIENIGCACRQEGLTGHGPSGLTRNAFVPQPYVGGSLHV